MEARRWLVWLVVVPMVMTPLTLAAMTEAEGAGGAPSDAAPTAERETSADPTPFAVVLTDGTTIPSQTRPLSAFGSVRYRDRGGKCRKIPAKRVDLEKTREINAVVPDDGSGGTLSVAGAERPYEGLEIDETEKPKPKPKSVTVYSATWCPHCRTLKDFLASQRIQATIIEVDRLAPAEQQRMQAEMRRLTGKVAYPTVVIGNQAKAGFSKSWILKQVHG